MNKIENSLNILHYCIYKAHYSLHLFFNKINPINLLHKLPFQKRKYQELGIDILSEINKSFSDTRFGLSITVAGGVLFAAIFFLMFGVTNTVMTILKGGMVFSPIHFIVFGIISAAGCYYFVFKKNKYLLYFKKFDKWTISEKRLYSWLSFAFILLIFFMIIVSFKYSKY